jgi:general secretion pathway protein H
MTTSATGDRSRGGFTLLEILLALALIAAIAATTIGLSTNLLNSRVATPEDVFWKASEAARKSALKSGIEVDLGFDDKQKAYTISDGSTVKTMAIPKADPDLSVDFLGPAGGASSSILVGGTLLETGAESYAAFYEDGTCSPFRVQFRAKGAAHVISIDPWTCAKVLSQSEGRP